MWTWQISKLYDLTGWQDAAISIWKGETLPISSTESVRSEFKFPFSHKAWCVTWDQSLSPSQPPSHDDNMEERRIMYTALSSFEERYNQNEINIPVSTRSSLAVLYQPICIGKSPEWNVVQTPGPAWLMVIRWLGRSLEQPWQPLLQQQATKRET